MKSKRESAKGNKRSWNLLQTPFEETRKYPELMGQHSNAQ